MTNIKLILSGIGILAVVVLVLVLRWGFGEIASLRANNLELRLSINQLQVALEDEQARSLRVEEAAVRLEEKDNARQRQLRDFSATLYTLSRENEELRSILDMVVPTELLQGLKAFSQ